MTTDKNPTSFRLSDQALDNLDAITRATGTTKTAAVETALALMAEKFKGENRENTMSTLYQVLRNSFTNTRLRYVGTILGDDGSPLDDPDRIMTGEEWDDALQSMYADDSENIFLDDHPDNVYSPDGGYYMQSGDIWYRGKQQGAECIFEVL